MIDGAEIVIVGGGAIGCSIAYHLAKLGQRDAEALARMTACREAFLGLLASDDSLVIYGVTSGYGQMARLRFSPEERKRHARWPRPLRDRGGKFVLAHGCPSPLTFAPSAGNAARVGRTRS